ncbi:hypothetical protein [Chitinimonas naiadis]
MNTHQHGKLAMTVAALFVVSSVYAATMNKTDYGTAKDRISADYKRDKAACSSDSGNAKDICKEQVSGKEKIAKAELEYRYSSKPGDGIKLSVAKADATFAVAKEMCDEKAGNAKDVCRTEAKAVHTKALADSKLTEKVGAAAKESIADKKDADYKVAAEKCDSMAGDAKSACVSMAKAKYQ